MLEGAHPRPADGRRGCGEELRANFRVFPLIVNSQVCSLLVAVGTKGCRSFAATIYSTDEDVICRVLLETLDKMANFEVLPRSRGEGSGQVIMRRLRPPNARMPPLHLHCKSARRVT